MKPTSPDTPSGLPKVTPELLKAFIGLPHDLEEDFEILKKENPAIAHHLTTGIDMLNPHHLREKRAFTLGALSVYMMLKHALATEEMEAMFNAPSIDGAGDADPQPSA